VPRWPDRQWRGPARLNNDTAPPPGDTLAELTEYEDGARIGYDPVTHALTALLPEGASALIEAPGGLTIRGDVTIEGTLTARDDVIGGGEPQGAHAWRVQSAWATRLYRTSVRCRLGMLQTSTPIIRLLVTRQKFPLYNQGKMVEKLSPKNFSRSRG
jgi:phage baseplate assembly protein gpV